MPRTRLRPGRLLPVCDTVVIVAINHIVAIAQRDAHQYPQLGPRAGQEVGQDVPVSLMLLHGSSSRADARTMLRPRLAVIGICQPNAQIVPCPIVSGPIVSGPIVSGPIVRPHCQATVRAPAPPTVADGLLSFGFPHQPFEPGEVGDSKVPTFSP